MKLISGKSLAIMATNKSYKDIATKEDKAFHARARAVLGNHKYMQLSIEAKKQFEKGMREPNEIKRENIARRLSNLVYTKAMADKI
mgnify:CR=1 FL=1